MSSPKVNGVFHPPTSFEFGKALRAAIELEGQAITAQVFPGNDDLYSVQFTRGAGIYEELYGMDVPKSWCMESIERAADAALSALFDLTDWNDALPTMPTVGGTFSNTIASITSVKKAFADLDRQIKSSPADDAIDWERYTGVKKGTARGR